MTQWKKSKIFWKDIKFNLARKEFKRKKLPTWTFAKKKHFEGPNLSVIIHTHDKASQDTSFKLSKKEQDNICSNLEWFYLSETIIYFS